jgi:hypothetical protein
MPTGDNLGIKRNEVQHETKYMRSSTTSTDETMAATPKAVMFFTIKVASSALPSFNYRKREENEIRRQI